MLLSLVSVKMKYGFFEAIFVYNPYLVIKSDLVELDA